jgi:hypothetical protein
MEGAAADGLTGTRREHQPIVVIAETEDVLG